MPIFCKAEIVRKIFSALLFSFFVSLFFISLPQPVLAAEVGEGMTCGVLDTCKEGFSCVDPGDPEPAICVEDGTLDEGARCDNTGRGGGNSKACKKGFECTNQSSGLFKTCEPSAEIINVPPPPCADPAPKEGEPYEVCEEFNTAIGTISTTPGGYVSTIFGALLSLSGGVALFLIMRAGYKIMMSSGNPEKIKEGREQLIAAIVGLIFLILSLVLLQFLSVDVLKLREFGGNQGTIGKGGSCDVAGNNQCKGGLKCVSVVGRSGTCR